MPPKSPTRRARNRGQVISLAFLILFHPAVTLVQASAPVFGYEVVHVYPHDPGAFTEGLIYENGFLYEGTGMWGESTLRKVEVETGTVLKRRDLPPGVFGEGVTALRDTLYQLTWQDYVGYSCVEQDSFELVETYPYPWEGWGLTNDGTHLIASDGSSTLRFLDPRTRAEISQIQVRDEALPVNYLNELEYVQGRIFANVLPTNRIAVIHPSTGLVEAWLDLGGLRDSVSYDPHSNILNGIAFDPANTLLFVTGKWWPKLFAIDVIPLHPAGLAGPAPALRARQALRISPNPARRWARIECGSLALRLFDGQGRLMRTMVDNAGGSEGRTIDLDLSDMDPGAYFLQAGSAANRETKKLLIVR